MIKRPLLACLLCLPMAACSTWYWPDTYYYPKGYTNHDITPISTPHGYNRTREQEKAFSTTIETNADAWRNAVADVTTSLMPGLDMNRPVAVAVDGGFSPLNASAANYMRDMLVKQTYTVALEGDATQVIHLKAVPDKAGGVALSAVLALNGKTIAQEKGVYDIPHQLVETSRLPGFTTHPVPAPAPRTPYDHLN